MSSGWWGRINLFKRKTPYVMKLLRKSMTTQGHVDKKMMTIGEAPPRNTREE